MAELGDVRLNKPTETVDAKHPRTGLYALLLVVAAVVLGISGYLVLRRPAPKPAAAAAPPAAVKKDTLLARERGDEVVLPPLDDTDPLVRELVGRLSSHPKVMAWLATQGLVRNFTVALVNVADGHSPAKQLTVLAPSTPFAASSDSGPAVILPASYARYDPLGDAVASIDARGAARLYATLKPRIDEAYRELGYPTGDSDAALRSAVVELLKTPVIDGPVAVRHSSVSYTYADPRLESLSPAQKQLLRMGPRNVRLIQNKLREMAPALGIDPATLPPAKGTT
jgi:hypothetical protein